MSHKAKYTIHSYPTVIAAIVQLLPYLEEYLLPLLVEQNVAAPDLVEYLLPLLVEQNVAAPDYEADSGGETSDEGEELEDENTACGYIYT